MIKSCWAWIWLAFLLVVDLVIPWFALRGIESFSGAFLFWIAWIVVAIASMFAIFLRWKE